MKKTWNSPSKSLCWTLVFVILLLFGAVRLPIEQSLTIEMQNRGLQEKPLPLTLRENLSQTGFAATLGGLRSLVASVLDLRAFLAFEENRWADLQSHYQVIPRLLPKQTSYWDIGSWHLGYNAASYYLDDVKGDQLRPAQRAKLRTRYIEEGRKLLEQGIQYNPQSARLHAALANYHRTSTAFAPDPDPSKAAKHYQKAYEISGREHYQRSVAYELVHTKDPENWQRAYQILSRHYQKAGRSRTASVVRDLKILEERLDIPLIQRLSISR